MTLLAKDLRSKTIEELNELMNKTKVEIEKAVSATMQGAEKDKGKVKRMRRDIAKIKTVLNEKKILLEVK